MLATLMRQFDAIETEYKVRPHRARQERARRAFFGSAAATCSSLPDVFDPPPNLWEPLLAVLEAAHSIPRGREQLMLASVLGNPETPLALLTQFVPPPENEQHWPYRFAELLLQAGCRADGVPCHGSRSIGGGAAAAAASAGSSSLCRSPLENWMISTHPLRHACGLVLLLRHGASARRVMSEPLLVYLADSAYPPQLINQLLDAAEQHDNFLGVDPLARVQPEGDTFAHALLRCCLRAADGEHQRQLLAVLNYEVRARPALWFELQLAKHCNGHGETLAMMLARTEGHGPFLHDVRECLRHAEQQWLQDRAFLHRAVESELSSGNAVFQANDVANLVLSYLYSEDALETKKT